jgi:hypothetical protein
MPDRTHTRPARPSSPAASRRSSPPKSPRQTRRLRLLPALGGLVLLGILLAAGGFGFAATQEQRDSFCSSCHSQPESTFFARSLAQPVDLASAHTAKNVQCINCHSGAGVTGRMSAELMGARNAVLWYTGRATQPAPLTYPIGDQNCLKCHQQVTASRGRINHFHFFLTRWQAADPQAGHCVSCHNGHTTDGESTLAFVNEPRAQAVCQACHAAIRGEED